MLKNSSKFTNAIKSDIREMKARVTINNIVLDDDVINKIDFSGSALSGEQFSLGSTHENSVSIEFSEVIETIAPLDLVQVEIGIKRESFNADKQQEYFNGVGKMRMGAPVNIWNVTEEYEYSLLGEFYVSDYVDINYNDKITTLECKDKMIFMEDAYVSDLDYPTDVRNVIVEIANQAGVEIDTLNIEELDGLQIDKIDGYSYRQALGFIAQLLVGYATFNHKGLLQIRTLNDTEYDVSPDEYFSKGLSKNGIRYKIRGITCTVPNEQEPQELFVGSKKGPQLTIENPLMTQSELQRIFNALQDVDYYPYELSWRGNPALEIGDVVTVYDLEGNELRVPNLNYTLNYTGGLSATSSADSKSRLDVVPSGRKTYQQQIHATQTKIKETATNLQNAFKDAQEKITGNQGGFIIQRLNEDGKPYEFLVMDTEDINSATNVIRLNQQGIGFSQNGYNGPFGVAITIDGQIVADYITAGTLRADLIQSGFNNIGDGFGVIISQDGLYSVSPKGEYSLVAEGGVQFYTKDDVLNGSIESSYTGDKTGVGVFIQPGHGFSVVRNNGSAADNVTIFQVPDDVDELRLRRHMNANAWNVFGANAYKTKRGEYEAIFMNYETGQSFVGGSTGARVGFLNADGTIHYVADFKKEGDISFFRHLDMENWSIKNAGSIDAMGTSSAARFNIKGTNQYLVNNSLGGGSYIDSQKVALGVGTLTSWINKLEVSSTGVKLFGLLDMNGQNIEKINFLSLGTGSTTSSLFTSTGGVLIAGGNSGISLGARQSDGTVTNLFRIYPEGAHISYRDINMAGNNITNTSDIRLKKNIHDATNDPLADIMKMRFATFEWDKDNPFNADKPDGVQFGQIAQYAPSIMQIQNGEKDHYLSISINKQVDLTSMATQRLNEERIKHAEEIDLLKTEIELLKEKIGV